MVQQFRFYPEESKKVILNTNSLEEFKNGIQFPNEVKQIRVQTLPGTIITFYQFFNSELKAIPITIDHSGIYNLDADIGIKSFSVNLNNLNTIPFSFFIMDIIF